MLSQRSCGYHPCDFQHHFFLDGGRARRQQARYALPVLREGDRWIARLNAGLEIKGNLGMVYCHRGGPL